MSNPYRIESLTLHHIGVFDHAHFSFKPQSELAQQAGKGEIHLLTGANGCGKSTVLYALTEIFRELHGYSRIGSRCRGEDFAIDFRFAGENGYFAAKVRHPDPQNGISPPAPLFDRSHNPMGGFPFSFGYGRIADWQTTPLAQLKQQALNWNVNQSSLRLPFAAFAYSGQRTLRDVPLTAIQPVNCSPFEQALSFDNTARPEVLVQWIANNRTQRALAHAEGNDAEAEQYERALQRIMDFISEVCELNLSVKLERSPLAVRLSMNGEVIPFDGLPDGLKSILSWVGDLALRLEAVPWESPSDDFARPITLLLDEVDIHLHPRWQRRILPALQRLLPNAQIFVSTHSPFVVGSVEDAWVYALPDPANRIAEQGAHTPREIEGVQSGAGKSYRAILDEVFGVSEEFDVESQRLLAQFHHMRDQVLRQACADQLLIDLAAMIGARGTELATLVTWEMRQLERLLKRELVRA